MHQTVLRQTLHYLARPHSGIPTAPLTGPAAWRGESLKGSWRETLTHADILELEQALDHSAHIPMSAMSASDFPLPTLSRKLSRWRASLERGLGFQVIRGLPVMRWGEERSSRCFWGLGQHLGLPGAQDPQGSLLGHVRNERLSDDTIRAYRTARAIAYHCDAADVVGLLCLRSAQEGGLSRLVSSVSVFNVLLQTAPELAARLFQPMWLDTRGDSAINAVPIPPCRYYSGQLRTFYHTDYFRSAARHASVPMFTPEDKATMDAYERIAGSEGMYLDMRLQSGDIQLVNNHTILHARTAYAPDSERHLLRLWLSLPRSVPLAGRFAIQRGHLGNIARLVRQGLREKVMRAASSMPALTG